MISKKAEQGTALGFSSSGLPFTSHLCCPCPSLVLTLAWPPLVMSSSYPDIQNSVTRVFTSMFPIHHLGVMAASLAGVGPSPFLSFSM